MKLSDFEKDHSIKQNSREETASIRECHSEDMRYGVLDSIRGLTLASMILYHTVWDLVFLFGHDFSWFGGIGTYIWQQSVCWSFILLSGFCWSMGKKKLFRGLQVFGAGLLITGITVWILPETRVLFGVLTLLGSCMLLMLPLSSVLNKIPPACGVIAGFLLFLFFRGTERGYLGFGGLALMRLPDVLYKNLFTAYLGFPEPGFYSADYFPMLPWLFLFVTGYFLYRLAEERRILAVLAGSRKTFWGIFGRHSLLIYMLHQPVICAVLCGIEYIFK